MHDLNGVNEQEKNIQENKFINHEDVKLNRNLNSQTIFILNEKFKFNQTKLKENLKATYSRLRNIKSKYIKSYLNKNLKNVIYLTSYDSNNNNNDNKKNVNNSSLKSFFTDLQYEYFKQKQENSNENSNETSEDSDDNQVSNNKLLDSSSNSENFWNSRRVRIGSEWQRVRIKLNLIKFKNKNINEFRKYLYSLKDDLNLNLEQETKSDSVHHFNNVNKLNSMKNDLVKLDQNLLKTFYLTLVYFKKNLFKTNCACDFDDYLNKKQNYFELETKTFLIKTCIFCHLFKKNDLEETKTESNVPTETETLVKIYHSYCKHPSNSNMLYQKSDTDLNNNLNLKRNFLDINNYYIDFDDGLLNSLVKERLDYLFENVNRFENSTLKSKINTKQIENGIEQYTSDEKLFDDILDKDVSLVFESNELKVKNLNNSSRKPKKRRKSFSYCSYQKSNFKDLRYNSKQEKISSTPSQLDKYLSSKINREKVQDLEVTNRKRKYSLNYSSKSIETNNPSAKTKRTSGNSLTIQNSSVSSTTSVVIPRYNNLSLTGDLYDINNIIIPSELLNNCKIIDFVKTKNVQTPKWRELALDPIFYLTSSLEEQLENHFYDKRHELEELKEKYHVLYKKLEKRKKIKFDASVSTKSMEEYYLEEFKVLAAKLKDEDQKFNDHERLLSLTKNFNNNNSNVDTEISESTDNSNDSSDVFIYNSKQADLWPSRVFPLNDQIYEDMLKKDKEQSETRHFSYFRNNMVLKRKEARSSRKNSLNLSINQSSDNFSMIDK